METTVQAAPAAPRRAANAPSAEAAAPTKPVRAKKKLPKADVEIIATAFFESFKLLPGAVKWRIVQKIEEYEDELDEKQLAAERTANPEDFDLQNAVPWEQVKAELATRDKHETDTQQRAA